MQIETPREKVERLLGDCVWRYAKTMPEIPHEYTVRDHWENQNDFEFIVRYIYKYGEKKRFWRTHYKYIYINGKKFWCMGNPVMETTIINRADIIDKTYDDINYSSLFTSEEFKKEEKEVFKQINYRSGSVLDIGCGFGLACEYLNPDEYLGIDPSKKLVKTFKDRFIDKDYKVQQKTFEEWYELNYYLNKKYDYIISLFGSPNYIKPKYLKLVKNLLKPTGNAYLMFYKPKYVPTTYIETNTYIPHFKYRKIEGFREKEIFGKYKVLYI